MALPKRAGGSRLAAWAAGVLAVGGAAASGCGSDVTSLPWGTTSAAGGQGAGGAGGDGATGGGVTGGGVTGGGPTGGAGGIIEPSCLAEIHPVCAKLGTSFCARYAECASFFSAMQWGDVEACETNVAAACQIGIQLADTGDDEVARVQSCAAEVDASSCAEFLGHLGGSCDPVPGARPNGSPCLSGTQCGSRFCAPSPDSCGSCADPPDEGDPCVHAECGPGMSCFRTGGLGGGYCAVPRGLGEQCSGKAEPPSCGAAFYCAPDGKCAERLAPGAECSYNPTQGGNLQPCDIPNGYACVPPSKGHCTGLVLAEPEQVCNPQSGLFCKGGQCVAATCVATIDVCEQGCAPDGAVCRYGRCDAGTCLPPAPDACD
jgi:hypothetical protein